MASQPTQDDPPGDDSFYILSPIDSISTPSSLGLYSLNSTPASTPRTPQRGERFVFPHVHASPSPSEVQAFQSPIRRHVASPGHPSSHASPVTNAFGLRTPQPYSTSAASPRRVTSALRGSPVASNSTHDVRAPITPTQVEGFKSQGKDQGSFLYKRTITQNVTTTTERYRPTLLSPAPFQPEPRVQSARAAPIRTHAHAGPSAALAPPPSPHGRFHAGIPISPSPSSRPRARPHVSISLSPSPPPTPPLPAEPTSVKRSTPATLSPPVAPAVLPPPPPSHSRFLVPWVNRRSKFIPLYEDDSDDSDDGQYLIPNPETMERPVLSEVGKTDYYVVTCGRDVGVFGSKREALAQIGNAPGGKYATRRTWNGARNLYTRAFENGEIRVIPLDGGKFNKP